MSSEFPRMLVLLRKEKEISQKQVAGDLGISQALLSHYEKGIRNPGLDFLVRVARYYKVSTDYLLGLSPERQGRTLLVEELPDANAAGKENVGVEGMYTQLNKKLLANSQNILFDLLTQLGHKKLTGEISAYLMLAVYRMYRVVFSTNPKNQPEMFKVPEHVYSQYTEAAMQLSEAQAKAIAQGKPLENASSIKKGKEPTITTESLSASYPLFASSLLNLVQTAENRMNFESDPPK